MDEFDALLSDQDFLTAVEELDEAVRMARGKRRVEPLMRRLELTTRKFFREQGSRFLRKFRAQLRSRFEAPLASATHVAETADDGSEPSRLAPAATSPHLQEQQIGGDEGRAAFERHAAMLARPLKESITPVEWLAIWYEVTQATDSLLTAPIQQAVQKTLLAGAMQSIADVGMRISFSLSNPRAQSYLRDYGAKRVTGINEETRGQLQTILDQAIGEGWSYDRTAKAITDKFEQFAVGSPLEHIDSRAHLVAVTEIGDAYCEANLEVAQDLAAAGIEMEKAWSTVGDDKVSQTICAPNEAQGWIPLEDAFQSGHDRPLGHPGCRCDLRTRRKVD